MMYSSASPAAKISSRWRLQRVILGSSSRPCASHTSLTMCPLLTPYVPANIRSTSLALLSSPRCISPSVASQLLTTLYPSTNTTGIPSPLSHSSPLSPARLARLLSTSSTRASFEGFLPNRFGVATLGLSAATAALASSFLSFAKRICFRTDTLMLGSTRGATAVVVCLLPPFDAERRLRGEEGEAMGAEGGGANRWTGERKDEGQQVVSVCAGRWGKGTGGGMGGHSLHPSVYAGSSAMGGSTESEERGRVDGRNGPADGMMKAEEPWPDADHMQPTTQRQSLLLLLGASGGVAVMRLGPLAAVAGSCCICIAEIFARVELVQCRLLPGVGFGCLRENVTTQGHH
mmetsp:Transcript_31608/g.91578  ORF Transcript_31608/g.91578 Transcript_31608/m.91578 type:complete len:346 (-) Transcript_31608:32-1069(-)